MPEQLDELYRVFHERVAAARQREVERGTRYEMLVKLCAHVLVLLVKVGAFLWAAERFWSSEYEAAIALLLFIGVPSLSWLWGINHELEKLNKRLS